MPTQSKKLAVGLNGKPDLQTFKTLELQAKLSFLRKLWQQDPQQYSDFLHAAYPTINQAPLAQLKRTASKWLLGNRYIKTPAYIEAQHQFLCDQRAKAIYQQCLYQRVLAMLNKDGQADKAYYDPQGHVIIDVSLSEGFCAEIVDKIEQANGYFPSQGTYYQALAQHLDGKPPTKVTECHLNVFANLDKAHYTVEQRQGLANAKAKFKTLYPSVETTNASQVPLFKEIHAHVQLLSRTLALGVEEHYAWYQKSSSEDIRTVYNTQHDAIQAAITQAREQTLSLVQAEVSKLVKRTSQTTMAEHRKYLTKFARDTFFKQLLAQKDIPENYNVLRNILSNHKEFKPQDVIASPNDIFTTFETQGFLNSGTRHTAHHKTAVEENSHDNSAYRATTLTDIDPQTGEFSPTLFIRGRNPAPVNTVIEDDKILIEQTIRHLDFLSSTHREILSLNTELALNIHLMTSLPQWYDKDKKNQQQRIARTQLQAVHRLNRQNLYSKVLKFSPLILLQHVPVNMHTRQLSMDTNNALVADLALMTHMALIENLYRQRESLPIEQQTAVIDCRDRVRTQYLAFLKSISNDVTDVNFATSDFARGETGAIASIKNMQSSLHDPKKQGANKELKNLDLRDLAIRALARIIATGDHLNPRYGHLIEALSLFNDNSTGGCKSANERYEKVALAYDVLAAIHQSEVKQRALNEDQERLKTAIKDYVTGQGSNPELLRDTLDETTGLLNRFGAACQISHKDQGGPAKNTTLSPWREWPYAKALVYAGALVALITLVAVTVFITLIVTAKLLPIALPVVVTKLLPALIAPLVLFHQGISNDIAGYFNSNHGVGSKFGAEASGASDMQSHKWSRKSLLNSFDEAVQATGHKPSEQAAATKPQRNGIFSMLSPTTLQQVGTSTAHSSTPAP